MWDGVRCKRVERLETPHEGNIFSVVWLPGSEDGQLVSGAGDCRVCLADLEAGAVTRNVAGHPGRAARLAGALRAPGAAPALRELWLQMQEPSACKRGVCKRGAAPPPAAAAAAEEASPGRRRVLRPGFQKGG